MQKRSSIEKKLILIIVCFLYIGLIETANSEEKTLDSLAPPQDGTPLLLNQEMPLLISIWQDLVRKESPRNVSQTIGNVGFISFINQSKGFRGRTVTIKGRLLQTRKIEGTGLKIKPVKQTDQPADQELTNWTIYESWVLLDDEKRTPLRLLTQSVPTGTFLYSSNDKEQKSNVKDRSATDSQNKENKYGKSRIEAIGVYYRLTPFSDGFDLYNTPTVVAKTFEFLSLDPAQKDPKEKKENYHWPLRLLLLFPVLLWIVFRRYMKRFQKTSKGVSILMSLFLTGTILFSGMVLTSGLTGSEDANKLPDKMDKTDHNNSNNNKIKNIGNNTSEGDSNGGGGIGTGAENNRKYRNENGFVPQKTIELLYRLAQRKRNPEKGIFFQGEIKKIDWINFSPEEIEMFGLKGCFRLEILSNAQIQNVLSVALPDFQVNRQGRCFYNDLQKNQKGKSGSSDFNGRQESLSQEADFEEEIRHKQKIGIGQMIGGQYIEIDPNTNAGSETGNKPDIDQGSEPGDKQTVTKNSVGIAAGQKSTARTFLLYKPEWFSPEIPLNWKINAGAFDSVPVYPNKALSILKKYEETLKKNGGKNSDSELINLQTMKRKVVRALRFTENDILFVQSFLSGIIKLKPGELAVRAREAGGRQELENSQQGKYFSAIELFNRPERWQGRLVLLKGRVRRAVYIPITEERFRAVSGLDHYYQLYLYTEDSQGFPLVISVPELPKGMPIGSDIEYREDVELAAFFCKTWAYRAAGSLEKMDDRPTKNPSENRDSSAIKNGSDQDNFTGNEKNSSNNKLSADSKNDSNKLSQEDGGSWLHVPFLIGGDVQWFPVSENNAAPQSFPWPFFWGSFVLLVIFYIGYSFVRTRFRKKV